MSRAAHRGIWLFCALLVFAGCTRKHYRIGADRETYRTLQEKTTGTPWNPPPWFNILPNPGSRFFDPTKIEDPLLPSPAPELYAYELPPIPERDPARFRPQDTAGYSADFGQERPGQLPVFLHPPNPADFPPGPILGEPHPVNGRIYGKSQDAVIREKGGILLAAFQENQAPYGDAQEDGELRINPIPKKVWASIPLKCLRRTLEFRSIRDEYKEEFKKAPGEDLRDTSQRLALEDILNLALINSRPYHTEKEKLYVAALALTFERYQFDCKFTPINNGSIVDLLHNRTRGITTNTLNIPSQFNADKILATGGTLLARFANRVVLTFNGPQGFASDIGSELLFEVTQTVFQRDVVFEPLTQAEREVVYAARDYARFRKTFFADLTSDYYDLINTYRNIEIATQNFFSTYRAFAQQETELLLGKPGRTRVQVDQLEQNYIDSRRSLIATCNTLENALDGLKFKIGIPPELPLNLNLTELEEITRRDEINVVGDQVRRARRYLELERKKEDEASRTILLNYAIQLTQRLLGANELRMKLGAKDIGRSKLEDLLATMRVDAAEINVEESRRVLATATRKSKIFDSSTALVDSLLELIRWQLNLAGKDTKASVISKLRDKGSDHRRELIKLRANRAEAEAKLQFEPDAKELDSANKLLKKVQTLENNVARLVPGPKLKGKEKTLKTRTEVDELLAKSKKIASGVEFGLPEIDLSMDDGMLTALTQRFDLMNFRGFQADEWRRIKLAGDDLRSILDLKATQVIRTDSRFNRPLAFTFDDSETRLFLQFDAPLNRKAQRNAFRVSLINYQAALRDRINKEDEIKIEVRVDLRALELDREQYRIAVSSAALAKEQVENVSKQLQLNKEGVFANNLVDAQRSYAQQLSNIASEHINFIKDRITLFLDLELLTVDPEGFWPELYDEKYQPTPFYHLPPIPPYGVLPRGVLYSHKVKRMKRIPPGLPALSFSTSSDNSQPEIRPEELPAPPAQFYSPNVSPPAVLGTPRDLERP